MTNKPITISMAPSHPGEFVKHEVLEASGLSITRASQILNVRRATLSDLLNEKSSMTPEMAFRFEKAFKVDMDMLLRMQAWYDGYQMRLKGKDIKVEEFEMS